jgi:hypothetical protein
MASLVVLGLEVLVSTALAVVAAAELMVVLVGLPYMAEVVAVAKVLPVELVELPYMAEAEAEVIVVVLVVFQHTVVMVGLTGWLARPQVVGAATARRVLGVKYVFGSGNKVHYVESL